MVPAPTYQNLPTFGTGATLIQPIAGTYNGGFLPGQLFPAEYENWLMNYITANSNTSETSVVNLVAEMGTILTAASITPNAGLTNQLYAALNALYLTLTGGTLTGGLTLGGVLNMASHKITNVADPTSAQDGATQNYVLSQVSAEATARANADTTLQNNINTKAPLPTYQNITLGGSNISPMSIGEIRFIQNSTGGGGASSPIAGTSYAIMSGTSVSTVGPNTFVFTSGVSGIIMRLS